MKNKILKFLFAVLLCEGAGIIGAFFTTPAIGSWYATLAKPSFNPPNWIFAPVWTLLFFLMGVALYLVFQEKSKGKNIQTALLVFFQQLALNVLWSALFFGMQNPKLAFAEIIVLWFAILMVIFYLAKISKTAAWLLVPYILWVSFAGYLNYSIWQISAHAPGQVACTMEAKLCLDGSAVGRTGPNCEFALCPPPIDNGENGILPFDSGVEGVVTLGPTCPVMREGDNSCADKPYATNIQVIAVGSPNSSPFATVESDKQGKYKIMLPSGEYALQPVGGEVMPRCETKEITIEPAKIIEVNLSCDTGIR